MKHNYYKVVTNADKGGMPPWSRQAGRAGANVIKRSYVWSYVPPAEL